MCTTQCALTRISLYIPTIIASEPHTRVGWRISLVYIYVSISSLFGPGWVPRKRANVGQLSKGQRSHVGQMGKKVSDFVLCFSLRFAYSKAAKVWLVALWRQQWG